MSTVIGPYQAANPPSLAAIERYPTLRSTSAAVAQQRRRIAERLRFAVARPELSAEFDTLLGEVGSGVLLLEGDAGAGITTLLCQFAAERRYPIWLPSDDAGDGLAALCAQVIAFHDLPIALVPPAATNDPLILAQLLGQAATRRATHEPIVVLADTSNGGLEAAAALPKWLPPGVVLVATSERGQPFPIPPSARLLMPSSGPTLIRSLVDAALARGVGRAQAASVAAHSGRSFLYVALACDLLARGLLARRTMPEGLLGLHRTWWSSLDERARRFAALIAAAGEPLPLGLAARVLDADTEHVRELVGGLGPFVEEVDERFALYHGATHTFLRENAARFLADAHQRLAGSGRGTSGEQSDDGYITRQLARHIALAGEQTRVVALPQVLERVWVLGQERRAGDLRQPARDALWALAASVEQNDVEGIVCAAAVVGTLSSRARRLAPDDAAAALERALDAGVPREQALGGVRQVVDQLPDGRDKALVLRRLGEVCFERGIRSQAMRMLAEALDLEVPGLPRSWRDEREEAQVALARAAIAADAPDRALGITARIAHPERRGLIETEVVRYLITHHQLTRAEEVALAIGHGHTHEWAMAEVAAGHARAGNLRRFREVLGTLKTETAIAWARGELACDAARRGDTTAVEQVALIARERLRDEALGLVAQALVAGGQAPSALMAARLIADRSIRARTLIDLALLRTVNTAAALALANDDIRAMDDERLPLAVLLASAYAAVGELAAALRTVESLDPGDERDRGRSRVAAALARAGELDTAARIAAAIPDDDERDWTMRELASAYAAIGRIDRADALVATIADTETRAAALADQCIARARAGRVASALARLEQITLPNERVRALTAIAAPMIARGYAASAEAALDSITDITARSRYAAALANAFADAGQLDEAVRQAEAIARPLDRARALVTCVRASVSRDRPRAIALLCRALQIAAGVGRSETIATLVAADDVLVDLGGTELLLTAAHALDEVDGWWG